MVKNLAESKCPNVSFRNAGHTEGVKLASPLLHSWFRPSIEWLKMTHKNTYLNGSKNHCYSVVVRKKILDKKSRCHNVNPYLLLTNCVPTQAFNPLFFGVFTWQMRRMDWFMSVIPQPEQSMIWVFMSALKFKLCLEILQLTREGLPSFLWILTLIPYLGSLLLDKLK